MRPIADMSRETAGKVDHVLADIDDTLTSEGKLRADAYLALERLCDAGISVTPVTGRPAGWCDMIARFWPVRGVVGENGAFYYSHDSKSRRMVRQYHPAARVHVEKPDRFARIRDRVAREVPGAAVSADQPFRVADLAIDFCEDVLDLPEADVRRIVEIFEEEGANAKVSSIHVNGWFGEYDKLEMTRIFARDILGANVDEENERFAFVGDSPNDAPMFAFFRNSCGVANVRDFAGSGEAMPEWVASERAGAGFCEIATHLLDARESGGRQ